MKRVFVDTSAWVALADRDDQFHAAATEKLSQLRRERLPQVTTNYILAETYTRLRRLLGLPATLQFGHGLRRLLDEGQITLVYADPAMDKAAWDIFRRYADQDFSFIDCTSFAWLRTASEAVVLAFDAHFSWMGFPLL
jgi:predicted nucleic acid-binding protein